MVKKVGCTKEELMRCVACAVTLTALDVKMERLPIWIPQVARQVGDAVARRAHEEDNWTEAYLYELIGTVLGYHQLTEEWELPLERITDWCVHLIECGVGKPSI